MVITESMVEGQDYVSCPICGKAFKFLSQRHLKPIHNLSREEFLQKYPNYNMCCKSHRNDVSKKTKLDWEDAKCREKRIKSVKEALNRPEVKRKVSEASKRMWKREGFHDENVKRINEGFANSSFGERQSHRMLEFWGDETNKVQRSNEIRKGIENSETYTSGRREYLVNMWNDPEQREKRSASIRKALSKPEEKKRRSEASINYWSKEESKRKMSELMKLMWQDPVYVKKVAEGYKDFKYTLKDGTVIHLRSSYEETACKYLENLGIDFGYELRSYKYFYNNGYHNYWPDFFLSESGLILEVKPGKFTVDPLVLEKFNSVIRNNENIIFVSESDLKSEEDFLKCLNLNDYPKAC